MNNSCCKFWCDIWFGRGGGGVEELIVEFGFGIIRSCSIVICICRCKICVSFIYIYIYVYLLIRLICLKIRSLRGYLE